MGHEDPSWLFPHNFHRFRSREKSCDSSAATVLSPKWLVSANHDYYWLVPSKLDSRFVNPRMLNSIQQGIYIWPGSSPCQCIPSFWRWHSGAPSTSTSHCPLVSRISFNDHPKLYWLTCLEIGLKIMAWKSQVPHVPNIDSGQRLTYEGRVVTPSTTNLRSSHIPICDRRKMFVAMQIQSNSREVQVADDA